MIPIKDFDRYLIDEYGNIRNSKSGRVMKHALNTKGYHFIMLSLNGRKKTFLVSRLVYQAFIGELIACLDVNHIDGNKNNNHVSNLELITRKENIRKAVLTNNIKSGFSSPLSKQVLQIDKHSGIVIMEHGSVSSAARFVGKAPSLISLAACGHRRSAYGFMWSFSKQKQQ